MRPHTETDPSAVFTGVHGFNTFAIQGTQTIQHTNKPNARRTTEPNKFMIYNIP